MAWRPQAVSVRMSAAQFALFQQPKGAATPRARKRRDELPENIIEGQMVGFLRAHGWTVTRQQSGTFAAAYLVRQIREALMSGKVGEAKRLCEDAYKRGAMLTVGEKGMADWRAERCHGDERFLVAPHQLFYFEVKAPGKRPSLEQMAWLRARTATGTPAGWFDDYEKFKAWYAEHFGTRRAT